MKEEERIHQQKQLVETIGRYLEEEGFQPTAGRIVGLLMVMDQEKFSFDEIVKKLQISKSSASIALRNLQLRGDIEVMTFPGDKKRYFEIKKKDTHTLLDDFEKKLKDFRDLLDRIIALKADQSSPNTQFYSKMIEMFDFFFSRMDKIKKDLKYR
jgi:DNA-binding transcriptional regulator GbsR (MarR family)